MATYKKAENIVISAGELYVAALGTTKPTTNLAFNGVWPDGWRSMGFTSDSVAINIEREFMDKMVEQAMGKIGSEVIGETLTVTTTLAELTMQNLQKVWDGIYTEVPATVGNRGFERLQGGGSGCAETILWGIEASYLKESTCVRYPIRFFCVGEGGRGGELTFKKGEQTGIPFTISGSHDLSQALGRQLFDMYKITAEAL